MNLRLTHCLHSSGNCGLIGARHFPRVLAQLASLTFGNRKSKAAGVKRRQVAAVQMQESATLG